MGLVVIKDITGKVINEITVPVVGGGWVALPKQACLGGAEWFLKMEPDTEMRIVGGIYSDTDRIGLWRILEDLTIDGPELSPWSATEQLAWLSISADNSPEPVELENPREQGYFTEGLLPGDFTETGVLVQQDRAVGWTFGTAEKKNLHGLWGWGPTTNQLNGWRPLPMGLNSSPNFRPKKHRLICARQLLLKTCGH
jgi:hypothetical protein